jgi:hypothetical protein
MVEIKVVLMKLLNRMVKVADMKFRDFVDLGSDDMESDQDFRYAQKQAKRKGWTGREDGGKDEKRKQGKPRNRAELRNRKYGDF